MAVTRQASSMWTLLAAGSVLVGCNRLAADPREGAPKGSQDFGQEVVVTRSPLNGVTAGWPAQGPAPITGGQAENAAPNNEVSGAIRVVVAHPTDANRLYVGAVNGGIWRTSNALAVNPTWTPLTDQQASLSIGGLAMDPGNANVLLAGFGAYSSLFGIGGRIGGLLLTSDGGNSWTTLNPAALANLSISSVEVRGATFLATTDASFSGLFRSIDTGSTWKLISGTAGLAFGPVSEVVGDRSNNARFYAGVLGVGIFRSEDSGASWMNVSQADTTGLQQAITGGGNNRIRIATGNDGRVFVGAVVSGNPGYLGFSADQGGTWTAMDLPRTPVTGAGTAITTVFNETPIRVRTAVNHGLTVGNGNQFVRLTGVTGPTNFNGDFRVVTPVAMDPLNEFRLVGTTATPGGSDGTGGNWTRWAGLTPNPKPGGQGATHFSVAVDPTNSSIVYVGGDRQDFPTFIGATTFSGRLFRGLTTTAPTNTIPSPQWAHLTHSNAVAAIPLGGTASASAPHADSRSMVFDAMGALVEGDDGGIMRRTSPRDNTGDWFSINGNLQVTELHDIAFDAISNVIIGGAQDTGNPQQSAANNVSWRDFAQGDGGDVQVDTTTAGMGRSIRYTSAFNFGGAARTTFDSTNNPVAGPTLLGLNIGAAATRPQFQFVTPLELNRANQLRLVIGATDAVWESSNQGDNITSLGAGGGATCMAYGHPSNAEILWVGAGGGVLVRTTAGGALAATAVPYPGAGAADIVLDSANAGTAYVASSVNCSAGVTQCVVRGTNNGANWEDITGDLNRLNPGVLRTILFVPGAANNKIFVGSDIGVFVSSTASIGFWNRVGQSLPRTLVMDLDYAPGTDTLYVGTLGRGAWSLATASAVDLPPAARCQPVTTPADATCHGTVTAAQVNNASFDPDGQAVTVGGLTPPGPYALGTTQVTLAVSSSGGNETCQAPVSVVDVTPPTITAPPNVTISVCVGANIGSATAADNCSVVITNNRPAKFPLGATVVTWTATDGSGNVKTATQQVTAILADDPSCCPTGTHIIVGNNASNQLTGTAGSDCIIGLGGDDVIDGRGGNDFISGGAGRDTIQGGFGADLINGGAGDDTINAGPDNDTVNGGSGTDICDGSSGINTVVACEVVAGG